MTLSELKNLYAQINTYLLKFPSKEDFQKINTHLENQFKISSLHQLPKEVSTAYADYQETLFKLQSIADEMGFLILTYTDEKAGKKDDDEVNYGGPYNSCDDLENDLENNKLTQKMTEVVRCYELLKRQYANFQLACAAAERNKIFRGEIAFDTETKRHITILPTEFSDELVNAVQEPVHNILEIMSGEFEIQTVNQELSKNLNLGIIEPNLLHENFGKDSYTSYFQDQSIFLPARTTNTTEQNKKVDDFIYRILEKSGFPETIKPNLKALLTTLTNQGVFAFRTCSVFMRFFSIHGMTILNFGADYRLHFRFDEKQQLQIEAIFNQNKYNLSTCQELTDITSLIKMNFTIAVAVKNNVPYFTLKQTEVTSSFATPKGYPMVIARNALNPSLRLKKDTLNVLSACMEYLNKFLGYESLEDFYIAKGKTLTSSRDNAEFKLLNLPEFLELACRNQSQSKQLSKKEFDLFQTIIDQYSLPKDKETMILSHQTVSNFVWEPTRVCQTICHFVEGQLNNSAVSKKDKRAYIHLLHLAQAIDGENCAKEIHALYVSLVSELSSTDAQFLIEAAKKDPELYQEMVNPKGLFTKKVNLQDEDHALYLANHIAILQGSHGAYFIKLLNNLKPQAKLIFLIQFAKNGGDIACLNMLTQDLFDKKFINYLTKAIKDDPTVFTQWNILVTKTSADTVECLRKEKVLEKIFVLYNEKILNQPLLEIFNFLLTLHDNKFLKRMGKEFLLRFVAALQKAASSENPEDFVTIPTITSQMGELFNRDSELLASDYIDGVLLLLNIAAKEAKAKLREILGEQQEESVATEVSAHIAQGNEKQTGFDESTSDEDDLKSFIEEEKKGNIDLTESQSIAKVKVKRFSLKDEKAILSQVQNVEEKEVFIPTDKLVGFHKGIYSTKSVQPLIKTEEPTTKGTLPTPIKVGHNL